MEKGIGQSTLILDIKALSTPIFWAIWFLFRYKTVFWDKDILGWVVGNFILLKWALGGGFFLVVSVSSFVK